MGYWWWLALGSGLALLAWSVMIVRVLLRGFLDTPDIVLDFSAREVPPPPGVLVEPLTFPGPGGRPMAAVLARPAAGPAPRSVVFFHEHGADGSSWAKYLPFLPAAGFNVLAPDFPGEGQSPGTPGRRSRKFICEREVAGAAAALAHASASLPPGGPVPVVAVSRGAAAALLLAARGAPVAGVVADSPISTHETILGNFRRLVSVYLPPGLVRCLPDAWFRFYNGLAIRVAGLLEGTTYPWVAREVQALPVPVLFVSAERDKNATPDQVAATARAAGPRAALWLVPGARHNGAVLTAPDEYRARVLAFLEALPPSP